LLLNAAQQEILIDSQTAVGAGRRSTALSSKCGQCHVDNRVHEAEQKLVDTAGI